MGVFNLLYIFVLARYGTYSCLRIFFQVKKICQFSLHPHCVKLGELCFMFCSWPSLRFWCCWSHICIVCIDLKRLLFCRFETIEKNVVTDNVYSICTTLNSQIVFSSVFLPYSLGMFFFLITDSQIHTLLFRRRMMLRVYLRYNNWIW